MMDILRNPKHERFVQLVAGGATAQAAYEQVWVGAKGARASAARLLTNATVVARIVAISRQISDKLLQASIRDTNYRVEALQNRHNLLLQVIRERGEVMGQLNMHGSPVQKKEKVEGEVDGTGMIAAPGAGTGLLCLDWRGKDADRAVWKVDTGLLSELRAIEEQAAKELHQWGTGSTGELPGGVAVQVNVAFVQPPPAA